MGADIKAVVGGRYFGLAVDAVIVHDGNVLLTKRAIPPFEGMWCLPGGHVGIDETMRQSLVREVREETGLEVVVGDLVGVYDALDRDPRGRVVAVAFCCDPAGTETVLNSEVSGFWWCPLAELPDVMGADHRQVLEDAKKVIG
ncbi:MAG: NUDIX hydrolase [Candidatus Diapherotrites archaeon]|nr:NUDIX hydrolase [Candidatus Diapherotrites archaeon]